jgi:hypothetical protein
LARRKANWEEGLIEQLSKDLMAAFPDMKGFSQSNLFYIEELEGELARNLGD